MLLADRVRVGLGEDRPHHRGDDALRRLRHAGQEVAHRVRSAALPGRTRQRGSDRVDQAGVGIRGDEPHAGEAAGDERAQEGEPGGAVLPRDDVEAERLAEAVSIDGDRVHDAGVDRPAALAALDLERVEDEVRVRSTVQRAGAEVLDDRVQ
jgi:hypothetical protein